MTRKFFPLIAVLVLAIAVVMVGCETDQTDADPDEGSFVVGISIANLTLPYEAWQFETCINRFESEFPEVTLITTDAGGDVHKQISDIEDLIIQNVDLIVMKPMEEAALTIVARNAEEAGIPVVMFDRGVLGGSWSALVKSDNVAAGQMLADMIAADFDGEANVVVIRAIPGASSDVDVFTGFYGALQSHPGINVLSEQSAYFRPEDAMSIMEDYMVAFDDIDAVFGWSDVAMMGAVNAIQQAGRDIKVYSIAGISAAGKLISEDKMRATALVRTGEKEVVDIVMSILHGRDFQKLTALEPVIISKENLDEWYDPDCDSFVMIHKGN